MSSQKERNYLLNFNRLLIYCCGVFGLLFDSTIAYLISMTLWVWLPSWVNVEQHIITHWRSQHVNAGMERKIHDENKYY